MHGTTGKHCIPNESHRRGGIPATRKKVHTIITTVCMNPAFDKTATVPSLLPGQTNILSDIRYDAGGKGVNVAGTLALLGVDVSCVGCLGAEDATTFLRLLAEQKQNLQLYYIELPGKTRTNLKLFDRETSTITEFNEPGFTISSPQLKAFFSLLQEKAKSSRFGVLSGSLPRDCPASAYQTCMRKLPHVEWVLDATGEAFLLGLPEKPLLVKPNLQELEALAQQKLPTLEAIHGAAVSLIRAGARNVIVSMGKEGALFTDGQITLFSPALAVETKSTVGAGDAMIGGFLMGISNGSDIRESFRYGVAAAAASVLPEGTQPLSADDFHALVPKVVQREL